MEKSAKRLFAVLLSALIIVAFMPAMVHASSDSLTKSQMKKATNVTVVKGSKSGTSLKAPKPGKTMYFKFVPKFSGYYGVSSVCKTYQGYVEIQMYNSKGKNTIDGGSEGINKNTMYISGSKFKAKKVYYISVTSNDNAKIKSAKLNVTAKIKLATVNGQVKSSWENKTIKTINAVMGQPGCTSMTILPSKGYAFKGIYYGKKKLGGVSTSGMNEYKFVFSSAVVGKTLKPVFVKIGDEATSVQNMKASDISYTIADKKINVTWTAGTEMNKYFVRITPNGDGSEWVEDEATAASYSSNFNANSGEKYTISIQGAKKIGGYWVYSDIATQEFTVQ